MRKSVKKNIQQPDFKIEKSCKGIVCGIDEVGRGPLAGPVVSAAVIFKPGAERASILKHVNDSKKLSITTRQEICIELQDIAFIGIGSADVEEIEIHNIYHATFIAMKRAYEALPAAGAPLPTHALVDGNRTPDLPCERRAIIKGDQLSYSIAAASIIAKEHRDTIMRTLALKHPEYGWETNAGYGTPSHLAALRQYGATPHHRKLFKPVSEVLSIRY